MNRKIYILSVFVIVALSLVGCGKNNSSNMSQQNEQSNSVLSASNSDISKSPEAVTPTITISASDTIDYNQYIKKTWIMNRDNNQENGVSFTISKIENNKMTGELTIVGSGQSCPNTIADLCGTINNDMAECHFTDSRENEGNIKLIFKPNDSIDVTIILTNKSDDDIAQPPEGTFQLIPLNLKNENAFSPIEDQSFMVDLNSWGKVKFVSGKFTSNDYVPIGFYLTDKDGDILYDFAPTITYNVDIKAVSFKDVNMDGLKDIIIIASNIENSDYVATIYLQESDWTFRNDPNLDQELNDSGNNKNIKAVTDYLSQKLATGLSLLEDDFVGDWNRTNTYMAYTGIITIKNLIDKSFDFSFNGFYGANSGTIDGTAVMTDRNKADFKYVPEYDKAVFAKVEFVFEKDSLLINLVEGDESALGFGHNVFIEGKYTKSEPIYLDANIINEILPTDKIKEEIRALLGDDVYEQMVLVIEHGIRYQVDGLTYSGFLSGAGEGVDLLINDNKIYCLGYGLDEDGFVYKLYTNDQDYKDKLPPFMSIERPDYKLQFVYKP